MRGQQRRDSLFEFELCKHAFLTSTKEAWWCDMLAFPAAVTSSI